jgi:hypothetical protein
MFAQLRQQRMLSPDGLSERVRDRVLLGLGINRRPLAGPIIDPYTTPFNLDGKQPQFGVSDKEVCLSIRRLAALEARDPGNRVEDCVSLR